MLSQRVSSLLTTVLGILGAAAYAANDTLAHGQLSWKAIGVSVGIAVFGYLTNNHLPSTKAAIKEANEPAKA